MASLCTPAHIYLVISLISYVFLVYYDRYHWNSSCLGSYHCNNDKPTYVYAVILLFIALWTWILQLQCNNNMTSLAWIEIVIPVLLLIVGFQINWNPISFMNPNFVANPSQY